MKLPHIFYIILQQLTNINNKGRDVVRFIFYLIIATFLGICLLPFQPYTSFILIVIILATLFYIASIVKDIYSEMIQSKE